MKNKYRVALICFSALYIAVVILGVLVFCGAIEPARVYLFMQVAQQGDILNCLLVILAGLLLITPAVCIMFMGMRKNKETVAVVQTADNGVISVNLGTVEQIALKAANMVKGVKCVKVGTMLAEGGINIGLRIAVTSDAVIPEVSVKTQKAVKEAVESMVGISVLALPVVVDNAISE